MTNLNLLLANNLRRIREERSLSLQQLAEVSGVSKSMLGQIERGEANPSVGTIWKIANGLRVSFTSLLNENAGTVRIVCRDDAHEVEQEDGMYRLLSYFPYDPSRRFEVYTIEIEPQSEHASEAHVKGVEEYLIVTEGVLELEVKDVIHTLKTGDAASFISDSWHCYRNRTTERTKCAVVLFYNE